MKTIKKAATLALAGSTLLGSLTAHAGLLLSDAPILLSSLDSTQVDQANYNLQSDAGGGKISADGKKIVFATIGPCGGSYDQIYVRDLNDLASAPKIVSSMDGTCAGVFNLPAEVPNISADGRYVVFRSNAPNAGVSNGQSQIFLKDLSNLSAPPKIVSSPDGVQIADRGSYSTLSSIGATVDGLHLYILFHSQASNLAAGVSGSHLFLKDMMNPALPPISAASDAASSDTGMISADGSKIIYIGSDYRTYSRRDIATGAVDGVGQVKSAKMSRDGNKIVYQKGNHCFVKDMALGLESQIDVDSAGLSNSANCWSPDISADGKFAAFDSDSTNLVIGASGSSQVYRKDLSNLLSDPLLVSTRNSSLSLASDIAANQANAESGYQYYDLDGPAMSGDGSEVVFMSFATNLVLNANTTNDYQLYVKGFNIEAPAPAPSPTPVKGKGKGKGKR